MGSAGSILTKTKIGAIAGLVGGFALFSSFMGIDAQQGVSPGTFYRVIGVSVGLTGMDAVVFGFFAHMLTAAVIGAIFVTVSAVIPILKIDRVHKGWIAGVTSALVVFAVFFMPIHTTWVVPTIQEKIAAGQADIDPEDAEAIANLLENQQRVLLGGLMLHAIYGIVTGFFAGMVLFEHYRSESSSTTTKRKA